MNKLVRIMFLSALLLVMTVSAAFASGVKDRSAAEISTAHYTDPSFDLSYPQVTMKDKKAEEKINLKTGRCRCFRRCRTRLGSPIRTKTRCQCQRPTDLPARYRGTGP